MPRLRDDYSVRVNEDLSKWRQRRRRDDWLDRQIRVLTPSIEHVVPAAKDREIVSPVKSGLKARRVRPDYRVKRTYIINADGHPRLRPHPRPCECSRPRAIDPVPKRSDIALISGQFCWRPAR